MRLRARRIRLVCLVRLLGLIAVLATSEAASAQVPQTPDELRAIVSAAAMRAGSAMGLLVDPRIVNEITASVGIFTTNFCYPTDSDQGRSNCRKTVADQVVMTDVLRGYLTEIVSELPRSLDTVGARLARVLGDDIGRAGWPSSGDSNAAILELPDSWRAASFTLQTANGPVPLGSGATLLLLSPGQVILSANLGGQNTTTTLQLTPQTRRRFAPSQSSDTVSVALGRIEPGSDAFCYALRPTAFVGANEVYNWGRARFGESDATRISNQAPFTRQVGLSIRVNDETGGLCKADCMSGLGIAFAKAIAVWRGGCERCDRNALSVIQLGKNMWMDERLPARIRRRASDASVSLDLMKREPGEQMTLIAAPSATVPSTSVVGYDDVTEDTEIKRAICSLRREDAPWVSGAQAFACQRSTMPPVILAPTLTLKRGATRCGPSRDFIACGRPGGDIEVTTDSVRYKLQTPHGAQTLATSADGDAIDLGAVILHEVGHWFGVPHDEVAGANAVHDVMGATYGDGELCVSAQAMLMVNNAADLRWPYRVNEGSGLRRPRNSTFGRQ